MWCNSAFLFKAWAYDLQEHLPNRSLGFDVQRSPRIYQRGQVHIAVVGCAGLAIWDHFLRHDASSLLGLCKESCTFMPEDLEALGVSLQCRWNWWRFPQEGKFWDETGLQGPQAPWKLLGRFWWKLILFPFLRTENISWEYIEFSCSHHQVLLCYALVFRGYNPNLMLLHQRVWTKTHLRLRMYLPQRILTVANTGTFGSEDYCELGSRFKAQHVKLMVWWVAYKVGKLTANSDA